MSDDLSFMKHYKPWWNTGCDACSVSEGGCTCLEDWEAYAGEGSIPKSWAWLIAPDITCRSCGHKMSTYDGCCSSGEAYLKYKYAVIFKPDWVPHLMKEINNG